METDLFAASMNALKPRIGLIDSFLGDFFDLRRNFQFELLLCHNHVSLYTTHTYFWPSKTRMRRTSPVEPALSLLKQK